MRERSESAGATPCSAAQAFASLARSSYGTRKTLDAEAESKKAGAGSVIPRSRSEDG